MPATTHMSWEPTRRRWWKMEDGKRFVVSVRQLRHHFHNPAIPDTKEGSYRHANQWWEQRSQQSSRTLALETQDMETGEPTGEFLAYTPEEIAYQKARHRQRIEDVTRLLNPDPCPVETTAAALVERYLGTLSARQRAGDISVSEYFNARAGLFHFRDWLGIDTGVRTVDAAKWEGYYEHLLTGPIKSLVSKRKNLRYARNFLTWLADMGVHASPPNLNRRYRFKSARQAIPTIPIENVKSVVHASRGQLRLHLLLMLNCGFTQQDISDLHPSEVDWVSGRIRRRRSKTSSHENVPITDYLLWSETFSLLQVFKSTDPDHVLLTASGRTWLRDSVRADGARSRVDAIQSNYRHLDVDPRPPLKTYRKVSSTLLDSSPEHGRYAVHFLGHAPDVAHKHYISSNGASFDASLRWLGEQYGF